MKADWSKETLLTLVSISNSNREVLIRQGIKDAETNYHTLRKYLSKYNIDTSHFHNQNHRKGKPSLNKKPLSEFLIEKSPFWYRATIKSRLVKEGLLKYTCDLCRNEGKWQNKRLVLRLDHINGVNDDNRLENLRFLCPNCDSQTEYYCRGNKPTYPNLVEETVLDTV